MNTVTDVTEIQSNTKHIGAHKWRYIEERLRQNNDFSLKINKTKAH